MKKINLALLMLLFYHLSPGENRRHEIDSISNTLSGKKSDTSRVNTLIELSKQYIEMDIYDSARITATQALKLSEKLNYDTGIAVSLRKLGVIESELSNYPKALEYYFASLKLSIKNNDKYEIFSCYNGIGMIYYFQNSPSQALDYCLRAEKMGLDNGMTFANLGAIYVQLNKPEIALNYYMRSLEYYTMHGNKNSIATIMNNIGTVYQDKNDGSSALDYYFKSLKIKQDLEDKQGISDALSNIADVYIGQKKYNRAIEFLKESLRIAVQANYLFNESQSEKTLSDIYDSIGNEKESYKYFKLYTTSKDSMFNEENTKKSVKEEMNFHYEQEQAQQKSEQEKKDAIAKTVIYSISVGLVLTLILSLFIFKQYRQKKKANLIIEAQKKLVEEKQQEVMASIRYAKRIQMALMPNEKYINKTMKRLTA